MWTILAKFGVPQALVVAIIAASGAWYVTHQMDLASYRSLQLRQEQANAAAQRAALAAKEKSEAELAAAVTRAATVARTLAAERQTLATALHQKLVEVPDASLRACLAMPLGSLLDNLPH